MKKVGNHNSISRKLYLSLALMLTLSLTSIAQEAAAVAPIATETPAATSGGDPVKGKELFNTNCAACHKLDAKSTGPMLRGISAKHEMPWLYKWIKNSSEMIKSGDAAAVKLFEENNKSVMTAFPQLSNGDIDNIIAYTSEPKAEATAVMPGPDANKGENTGDNAGISNNLILGALVLVLAILIVMLFLVNNVLRKVAAANGIEVAQKEPTTPIWKAFIKNQFLVLVSSIFLLLSSAYFVYGFFMQVGVDQEFTLVKTKLIVNIVTLQHVLVKMEEFHRLMCV
jgi:mono/diheme cytochrome c family protein